MMDYFESHEFESAFKPMELLYPSEVPQAQ